MRITVQFATVPVLAVLLSGGMLSASEQSTEPDKFFREYVGLADDQMVHPAFGVYETDSRAVSGRFHSEAQRKRSSPAAVLHLGKQDGR